MSVKIGEIAEMEFALKAVKRNLCVLRPTSHFSKYDLLVDNGKRFIRIQVKSTSCESGSKNCEGYSVSVSHGNSKKVKYTKEEIDFYAIYIMPKDVWYFIPVAAVDAVKITIMTESTRSKYAVFKNNWDLLTH